MKITRVLSPFKKGFVIYYDQLFNILLISFLYVFPLMIFVTSGSAIGMIFFGDSLTNILTLFFSIVGLCLSQIPYIYMAKCRGDGTEITIKGIFLSVKRNVSSIYVMTLLVAFLVSIGFQILILPGVICLVLLILFPQISVIENIFYLDSVKRAFHTGSTNFWHILNVILFFIMVDWWILWSGKALLSMFNSSNIMVLLAHLVIQICVLPYFSFVITSLYLDQSEVENRDQYENFL